MRGLHVNAGRFKTCISYSQLVPSNCSDMSVWQYIPNHMHVSSTLYPCVKIFSSPEVIETTIVLLHISHFCWTNSENIFDMELQTFNIESQLKWYHTFQINSFTQHFSLNENNCILNKHGILYADSITQSVRTNTA